MATKTNSNYALLHLMELRYTYIYYENQRHIYVYPLTFIGSKIITHYIMLSCICNVAGTKTHDYLHRHRNNTY